MAKKKINVEGLVIAIGQEGYISLTDIAKRSSKNKLVGLGRLSSITV